MFKKLIELFDMSREEAEQIDAIEAASRGKVMLDQANRTLTAADRRIAKAEKDLWAAQLECQKQYRDYLHARQQLPQSRKAEGALEYVAKLKLAARRWEMAERLCDRGRERLANARQARKDAKTQQTKAQTLIRQANRSLGKAQRNDSH